MDREELIRERAYLIWDAEKRPAGRELEHWDRASREISEQEAAPSDTGTTEGGVTIQPPQAGDVEPPNKSGAAPPATERPKRATKARASKDTVKPAMARGARSTTGKTTH